MKDKAQFIEYYNTFIKREGADKLLQFLEESDFFTAPASTKFHGAKVGGLCEHSINVFIALSKSEIATKQCSRETIAIVSLLHDICKTNFYKKDFRNVKEDGKWKQVDCFVVDDKLPMGHSEKSIYLINKYMKLTDEEAMAINAHMGGFDARCKGTDYTISNIFDICPLAVELHIADLRATYHMD